jgi:hypothetical protein
MSDIYRSPEDAPDVMLGTRSNELPDCDGWDDIAAYEGFWNDILDGPVSSVDANERRTT